MTENDERRLSADRRRQPRGGRRSSDHAGFSPLVLVVNQDASGRAACEAILAKLRFAVAPIESVDKAAAIVNSLRPEIIVAADGAADELRSRLAGGPRGNSSIPIVAISSSTGPDELVDRIREALRHRSTRH